MWSNYPTLPSVIVRPTGLNSGGAMAGSHCNRRVYSTNLTTSHQILHSHGQFLLTKTYIFLASIGLHDQCTLRPLVKSQAARPARQDRIMIILQTLTVIARISCSALVLPVTAVCSVQCLHKSVPTYLEIFLVSSSCPSP